MSAKVPASGLVNRGALADALARGGGTSLAGQCCNDAVVLDLSWHLSRILAVDAEHRCALVEAGVVLDDLRAATDEHGLTPGPDPATHTHCTLGGMIGNNSCGVHSILAGCTADTMLELEVLTYDGTRMWVGATDEQQYSDTAGAGGRPAEIYRALRERRDRYTDLVRERYPATPAASPATTSISSSPTWLQPRSCAGRQ